MGMIRFLTLGALMLWLAKPSCAICCVESLAATEQRETAAVRQLPIADDCCPSSEAERGIPSARTCCLLDEHSNDFTHHSPDRMSQASKLFFKNYCYLSVHVVAWCRPLSLPLT